MRYSLSGRCALRLALFLRIYSLRSLRTKTKAENIGVDGDLLDLEAQKCKELRFHSDGEIHIHFIEALHTY
jgi:hypothetical protein